MARPRLLDLFCGAGGCSVGYHRSGFDVVGVDNRKQPHYPFRFHLADAFEYLWNHWFDFDAIHASPPCQRFSVMTRRWGRSDEHPDFIEPIREMLLSFHIPFVIENVMGSPLRHPVMLCGSAFGLEVRRHRFFEMSDAPALYPVCQHTKKALAVFGHPGGSSKRAPEARFGSIQEWRDGMGIDWMDAKELAQSIPPAYTEWIGKRLLEQLNLKGGDALT